MVANLGHPNEEFTTITDRLVTHADLPTIMRIEREAYPENRWHTEEQLKRRIDMFPQGLMLGLINGEAAGFISCFPVGEHTSQRELAADVHRLIDLRGKIWFMKNLAVRKKFQRLGLGHALVFKQMKIGRTLGMTHFRFTAPPELREYYRMMGCVQIQKVRKLHGIPQAIWEKTL